MLDESNAFMMPQPTRVQTAPTESSRKQTGRRVRRQINARQSYTIVAVFSVTGKGKLVILTERCRADMKANIQCGYRTEAFY